MNKKNLEYNGKDGIYTDKYNGVNYVKIDNNFVPLVAGGLPAELEEHNGNNYLVNSLGTYEIVDGKASFEPLKSTLDASPLFFGEDGKLHSEYNDYVHELVGENPIALYDPENNLPAEIKVSETGEKVLVSEQGEYRITEEGTVMTPSEERFLREKEIEKEFFSDQERCERYLASSPEERKIMMDEFKKEHGIEEIEEYQETAEETDLEGIPEVEECCEDVNMSGIEEGVTEIQQGVQEQEILQNQEVIETPTQENEI